MFEFPDDIRDALHHAQQVITATIVNLTAMQHTTSRINGERTRTGGRKRICNGGTPQQRMPTPARDCVQWQRRWRKPTTQVPRLDYPISVLYIHTVRQSEPILRCWYVCEGRFHGGWDGPRMLNHTPNPPKVGSGCDKGPQNSLWQLCNFLFFFFPAKKVIWTHFAREPLRAVCARLWGAGCIPGRSDQNLATLQPASQRRS